MRTGKWMTLLVLLHQENVTLSNVNIQALEHAKGSGVWEVHPKHPKHAPWKQHHRQRTNTKLSSLSCLPVPERTNSHKTVKKRPSITVGYVICWGRKCIHFWFTKNVFFYSNALLFHCFFLCKQTRRTCMTVTLASFATLCRSATFLRRCVKLKSFQLLHAALLINVSSKTVDQSEELGGGASIASFCLQ